MPFRPQLGFTPEPNEEPLIVVGGSFSSIGGIDAQAIAMWDGVAWSPLGDGFDGHVYALAVMDEGGTPTLFAAGHFARSGETAVEHIAKWDGNAWLPVGDGLSGGTVEALAVFDDGGGPALYAAGSFTQSGITPIGRIARWTGTQWDALGEADSTIWALGVFDNGTGSALYAGGSFSAIDATPTPSRVARWDGSTWTPVGAENNGTVMAFAVFEEAGTDRLYRGTANSVGVSWWDGIAWQSAGSDPPWRGSSLTVADAGDGLRLYAGGSFPGSSGDAPDGVGSWDGATWRRLGGGLTDSYPKALTAVEIASDGAPAILFGGVFSGAEGQVVNNLAIWNNASWSAVPGSRPGHGVAADIFALVTFDDGSGEKLYAAGMFEVAGQGWARGVACWDGAQWAPLGDGLDGTVYTLAVYDDGAGPKLYAGGSFDVPGPVPTRNIAKWNGTKWRRVGDGIDSTVLRLLAHEWHGTQVLSVGALSGSIRQWDGADWTTLPPISEEYQAQVWGLEVCDLGDGPILYAGGVFISEAIWG